MKHEADFQPAAPTVNVVNILRVADAIERAEVPGLGFNMSHYVSERGACSDKSGKGCGTTACIAGWAMIIMQPSSDNIVRTIYNTASSDLETWLGISQDVAWKLFFSGGNFSHNEVTPAHAARTLRHLAETGEVNWNLPEA